MFEKMTNEARFVVIQSQVHARALNHNYIGTEHSLIALTDVKDGVVPAVFDKLGISADEVMTKVLAIVNKGITTPSGHIPFTPRMKGVWELSLREALQLGHNYINPEHILLAIITEGEGIAAEVLDSFGIDSSAIKGAVIAELASASDYTTAYAYKPTERSAQRTERPTPRPLSGNNLSLMSEDNLTRIASALERIAVVLERDDSL